MVNLERMLRELIQSQLGKAKGHAVPAEEQVVDLDAVAADAAMDDLATETQDHGGNLDERHIESRLKVDENLGGERAHIESRLQGKEHFDHEVAHIKQKDIHDPHKPSGPARESLASQVRHMLAEPGGAAQAVIMAEIINRPTDRWQDTPSGQRPE